MSERFVKRIIDNWEVYIVDNENGKEYGANVDRIIGLLNMQQATIEMYQRRVDKREEQISIIKKHCLKFLTDEQFEIIRKELDDE